MRAFHLLSLVVLAAPLLALGCSQPAQAPQDKEAKIKEALDQLDPADRKLALEQKYCAVQTKNRLGSMGKPIKVMVKDEPVFLCCKSCMKEATDEPDKTLASVKNLKTANADTAAKGRQTNR
jgi:hypothetical protein